MTTTLERYKSEYIKDQRELIKNQSSTVQVKARNMLGYSGPVPNIGSFTRESSLYELESVMKACDDTGCRYPFTHESVIAYMDEMTKMHPVTYAFLRSENAIRNLFTFALSAGVVTGLVISLINRYNVVDALGTMAVSIIFGVLITGFVACVVETFIDNRKWVHQPLKGYTDQVPEFALQTAVDLRPALGAGFEFGVCELTHVPDPFLTMKSSSTGRIYYLEVWNEPNYKQERYA